MTDEDRDEFIDIMDRTALIKDVSVSPERADAWFGELKGFRLDAIRAAFVWCRREKAWFPDLADVVTYARAWEGVHPEYSTEYLDDLARQRTAGEEGKEELMKGAKQLFSEEGG